MTVHVFAQSLTEGQRIERALDAYFGKWFDLRPVDLQIEKQDRIDRIAVQKSNGRELRLEYKKDGRAASTGNLFLETESDGKPSWAANCRADFLIIAVPCLNTAFVFKPKTIQANIGPWKGHYGEREAWTEGWYETYSGLGVCVPIRIMRTFAVTTIYLPIAVEAN